MAKLKVGIVGHTGRAGKELFKRLNRHPLAEVVYTDSRSDGTKGDVRHAKLIFCCTSNEISKDIVPRFLKEGKKVIDFSRAFRCVKHIGIPGNEDPIYGLPESYRNLIRRAKLVANPGCYATAAILALQPINSSIGNIRISAVSGISGSGKHPTGRDNLKSYMPGRMHDHIKEIELHGLYDISDNNAEKILFTPVVADNIDREIYMTIFANASVPFDAKTKLEKFYGREKFIRIKDICELKDVIGTNFCDISATTEGNNIVIISALDNLVKGAAGQAVQNMNIMHRFDEGAGIEE
jgi:N-acetyl-gamma-glutamyl-phosphate reductase